MVFSSSIFLLYFLPAFLLLYHLVPGNWKNYVILIASITFYAWGAPKFLFVILGSTILDFYIVRQLYRSEAKKARKSWLAVSLSLNLGLLAYFKYANFFVENLNAALLEMGVEEVAWTKVLLPIGISFYTFQTLTYSIDIYRGVHAPLKKITDYLLYIMSFPQMIAGPIVRYHLIAEQITSRKENIDDKLTGFFRFAIGLGKKVLIANVMAEQADLIFDGDLSQLTTANAWLGMIAYTFQIYFDFSGYSDMAIGLGKMIGFKLPENFNSPYVARSISEFWRRWHMTLGAFMRDYLYIPLGGNRVKTRSRLFFNLWVVFLLSGLWHGASWNFVLWGAFHGAFLVLDRLFLLKLLGKVGAIPATLFTFLTVMIGWVIFRIETLSEIPIYLGKLFAFDSTIPSDIQPAFPFILVFAVIFSFAPGLKWGDDLGKYLLRSKSFPLRIQFFWTMVALALVMLSVSSILSSGFNPFIYYRF